MIPLRKLRRSSLFGMMTLVCLSTYILLIRHPIFAPAIAISTKVDAHAAAQIAVALETVENSRQASLDQLHLSKSRRPQIKLTPDQELAAVSSFLTSLTQVVIPSFVDPTLPIDPQLILDFDTRNPRAVRELENLVNDVWTRNPIFLYSKVCSSIFDSFLKLISFSDIHPLLAKSSQFWTPCVYFHHRPS
jgi:hypothetical protein